MIRTFNNYKARTNSREYLRKSVESAEIPTRLNLNEMKHK